MGLYANSKPEYGESSKRNGRNSIVNHIKRGETLEEDDVDNNGLRADSCVCDSWVGAWQGA